MAEVLKKSQAIHNFMENLLREFQFDSSPKNDIHAA